MSLARCSHLSFVVPREDALAFSGLPAATQDRVRWLLSCMRAIASSPRKTEACHQVAAAANPRMHFNTIYGIWKRFRDSADWRMLIDKRKTSEFWKRDPSKVIGLPEEFVTYWKTLCEENQRAFRPARRALIIRWENWRAGDLAAAVPGYFRCPPPAPGSDCPLGWTYSNLLNYKPTDVELAAARQGRDAALSLLPGVRTTRIGSYPFAEIQFDDMWHDFEVNAPGQKRSCRLLEFNAADHFSNFIFRPGLKPRIINQDDGKRRQLDQRDFHLYLINWLLDYGVHPDGTKFNVENGTAAINKAFEDKLTMWFDGRLTVIRSGMSGAPAHAGAYRERAKGNFRVKAIKEGAGRLIHNHLAALPGQVGMNRDNLPASYEGRSRENEALLFLQASVPALAGKLAMSLLDLKEAVYAVNLAYDQLNARTDHAIEGWEECGLVIDEFRADPRFGGWLPLQELLQEVAPAQAGLIKLHLQRDPHLRRRRSLSPQECLTPHADSLIRLPDAAVPDLLGPEYGAVRDARQGIFEFTWPGFGKLRYFAKYQDPDGFRRRVENGSSVLIHLNPWKPERIYLSDPVTRRFLGCAERDTSVHRGDVEALNRRQGEVVRDYNEATRELAARHGIKRIPHLKANTAALRGAAKPSVREREVAAAGFDAGALLDPSQDEAPATADASAYFDPADLL